MSVSDGPTSILWDIVIVLRKSHEIVFVTYFWKTKHTCERCFWDVLKTSLKKKKDIFFDMYLRYLKDVTKKTSFEMFLRGLWNISLNGDLIEISQRHLMAAGYVFNLKAKVIHLSFCFVQIIWKNMLLAHNYADLELLKKPLIFCMYLIFLCCCLFMIVT